MTPSEPVSPQPPDRGPDLAEAELVVFDTALECTEGQLDLVMDEYYRRGDVVRVVAQLLHRWHVDMEDEQIAAIHNVDLPFACLVNKLSRFAGGIPENGYETEAPVEQVLVSLADIFGQEAPDA